MKGYVLNNPLVITSLLEESLNSIAAGICTIWEANVDTPAVYAEQCRVQDVDFAQSVMARTDAGAFAGVGVMCRRGTQGFVLDFGIAPAFRGQGYGHVLFAELFKRASMAGITHISLVVNTDNVAAQRIYQAAGFCRIRTQVTLRRRCSDLAVGEAVEVHTPLAKRITTWARFNSEHGPRPYWERNLPSLLSMADTRAFETPHGFVLARRSAYFRQVDAVQLVLTPEAAPHELQALLFAVSKAYAHRLPVAVPEEPLDSILTQQLKALGFKTTERAYEMAWEG